ncbi:MAG TPA: transglycosylase SLT domain-containing protein [Chloroflexota bacterium]|jgi:soluble lytic murein transglycosylase-like protein
MLIGLGVAGGVSAEARRAASDSPSSALVGAPVAVVPAEPRVAPDLLPARADFETDVERWRTVTASAAQTVRRTTGVSLDADLLLALVAVESAGQPDARSATGAVGLMQVQPATFADLRARYGPLLAGHSLEQPTTNVLAGALYLADCTRLLRADLKDRGDLNLVLDAYNLGPRATREWRENGTWTDLMAGNAQVRHELPRETIEHAARIMAVYRPGPISPPITTESRGRPRVAPEHGV